LASGDVEGTLKLWDVGASKIVATRQAHASSIVGLGFAQNAIVTDGWDGKLGIWNIKIWNPIPQAALMWAPLPRWLLAPKTILRSLVVGPELNGPDKHLAVHASELVVKPVTDNGSCAI
jgi:WD40 repeat protein